MLAAIPQIADAVTRMTATRKSMPTLPQPSASPTMPCARCSVRPPSTVERRLGLPGLARVDHLPFAVSQPAASQPREHRIERARADLRRLTSPPPSVPRAASPSGNATPSALAGSAGRHYSCDFRLLDHVDISLYRDTSKPLFRRRCRGLCYAPARDFVMNAPIIDRSALLHHIRAIGKIPADDRRLPAARRGGAYPR